MEDVKILIVEDEAITALFIQECLENIGFKVVDTVATGHEAIDISEKLRPDLVLMDIKLDGDLNGIETARIIYNLFNIPVVYLTAYSDNDTLEKAILTGPFGYLLKPVEEKALRPAIEIALLKHKEESKLKNTNNWLTTMVKNINDAIIAIDFHGLIKFINKETELISNWENDEIADKRLEEIFSLSEKGTDKTFEEQVDYLQKNLKQQDLLKPAVIKTKNKRIIEVEFNFSSITDDNGKVHGFIITFSQINQQNNKKSSENEYEMLDMKMKQLNNLIGICSFCKKIRDDTGQWSQLESYLQREFDILFSHGVCPDCAKKFY
jgi:PAS domain S-box-containing protein